MSAAPCPHGMPSPSSCLTCMEDVGLGADPVEPVTVVARFTATFDGRCTKCDDDILPGDRMARLSDERYVCASCADEVAR